MGFFCWTVKTVGRLQVILAGVIILLNTFLIHALYRSSTSLLVYMLLHLYNTVTPILMMYYGRRCCSLAGCVSVLFQRNDFAALIISIRSVLWLAVTGVLCGFLILIGEMGNTYESSYRLVGDFRSIPTYLQNMMNTSRKASYPQEEGELWITTVKDTLCDAYRLSSAWLTLLPIILSAWMLKKFTDDVDTVNMAEGGSAYEDSNQDDLKLGNAMFGTGLGGYVLRGLMELLFLGVVSFLLFGIPFMASFVLHVFLVLCLLGVATFVLRSYRAAPAKVKEPASRKYRPRYCGQTLA